MDRRTALERLDTVRPGSDDLALPDLSGLRNELAGDATLAAEFERRQNWDRRFTAAMQDVPIPDDLKDRILTRLASATPASSENRTRFSRRKMLALAGSLAASAVLGGLFVANASAAPLSVVEVRDAAGALLEQQTEPQPFSGDFTPELPSGRLPERLRFREPLLGLLDQRVAAWRFQAEGRRPLRGVLAVLPLEDVSKPPAAQSLADREYVGAGNAVAWREGGFVYVCYVDGGIDELIRRLGGGPIA